MNLEKIAKQFLADRLQAGIRYFVLIEDTKKCGWLKVRRQEGAEEGVQKNHLDADVNAWLQEKGIAVEGKQLSSLHFEVGRALPPVYRGEALKKYDRAMKRAQRTREIGG